MGSGMIVDQVGKREYFDLIGGRNHFRKSTMTDIVNQWQPAGADPDVVKVITDQCKEQLAEVRDKTRLYEAVLTRYLRQKI